MFTVAALRISISIVIFEDVVRELPIAVIAEVTAEREGTLACGGWGSRAVAATHLLWAMSKPGKESARSLDFADIGRAGDVVTGLQRDMRARWVEAAAQHRPVQRQQRSINFQVVNHDVDGRCQPPS
jgi:hypothetical protein